MLHVKTVQHQVDLNSQAAKIVLDVWGDNTDLSVAKLTRTQAYDLAMNSAQDTLSHILILS